MEMEQPQIPIMPFLAGEPALPEEKHLAPVWHTIVMVLVMVGNSVLTARYVTTGMPANTTSHMRILQYGLTIGFELALLLFVWFGLRLHRHTMRELIGGKWSTIEDFLLDLAVAAGFW